jgi:hypothetical protein
MLMEARSAVPAPVRRPASRKSAGVELQKTNASRNIVDQGILSGYSP